jgi:hypothetical protein
MAAEILKLAQRGNRNGPGLLVMTGHQDGILAYGCSAQTTGKRVIETLTRALQAR